MNRVDNQVVDFLDAIQIPCDICEKVICDGFCEQ